MSGAFRAYCPAKRPFHKVFLFLSGCCSRGMSVSGKYAHVTLGKWMKVMSTAFTFFMHMNVRRQSILTCLGPMPGMIGRTGHHRLQSRARQTTPPMPRRPRRVFPSWEREVGMGQKIEPPENRRLWSLFPFARVPFCVPIFDPHPSEGPLPTLRSHCFFKYGLSQAGS